MSFKETSSYGEEDQIATKVGARVVSVPAILLFGETAQRVVWQQVAPHSGTASSLRRPRVVRAVTVLDHMIAKKTARITNAEGLHFRSWGALVKLADHYDSEIRITRSGITVNAKEMISLALLATQGELQGGIVEIEAVGCDAIAAIAALWEFVENGCGEKI
jgi:phosphocarrier protein